LCGDIAVAFQEFTDGAVDFAKSKAFCPSPADVTDTVRGTNTGRPLTPR
jgi:hypothetical protein